MYHQYARTHSSHTVSSRPIWRCKFLISSVGLTTMNVSKFCSKKYGKWKAWYVQLDRRGYYLHVPPVFMRHFFSSALQRSVNGSENGNKRKRFDNNQQPKCKSRFRIMHKDYGLLISYYIDSRKAIFSVESNQNESNWAKTKEEYFFLLGAVGLFVKRWHNQTIEHDNPTTMIMWQCEMDTNLYNGEKKSIWSNGWLYCRNKSHAQIFIFIK